MYEYPGKRQSFPLKQENRIFAKETV